MTKASATPSKTMPVPAGPSIVTETISRERVKARVEVDLVRNIGRREVEQRMRLDVDFGPADAETLTELGDALIADGVIEPGFQRPAAAALRHMVRALTRQRLAARSLTV